MKIHVEHVVVVVVEEHTPEHERVRGAIDELRRAHYVSLTSERHGGDVTYRIDADVDADALTIIRTLEVGS